MDNFWKIIILVTIVLGFGLTSSLVTGNGGYFIMASILLGLAGLFYGIYKAAYE